MKELHGVRDTKCLRRYHVLLVTGAARFWLARYDFLLVFYTVLHTLTIRTAWNCIWYLLW